MTDVCAGEVQHAWTRGVCDGLELAARTITGVLPHLDEPSTQLAYSFIVALRTFQVQIQIEGLPS